MRVVVFFIYLFLNLLWGSNLHAAVQHHHTNYPSHHHSSKSRHIKFTNTDQSIFIIGDTDLDLDEEYARGDDVNDESNPGLLSMHDGLLTKWYLSFFPLLILDDQRKDFKIFTSFSGSSSPIYITQRVLRIWEVSHQLSIWVLFSYVNRSKLYPLAVRDYVLTIALMNFYI